jgi:signal transduction histidine kinase
LDNTPVQLIVEPAPKVWIQVDPQQMEQVLINLVQNAAESIERDGTITLRARSSVARLGGRSRPVVILEVADTGKGMPPAVQKRLFDPFFTTKESGTGLGLPIAARIVEKHGGVLQCHTEVGRGTTFGIVLPRMEKDKNEGQA